MNQIAVVILVMRRVMCGAELAKKKSNEYVSKTVRLAVSIDNPEAAGVLSAVTGAIVYSYLLHSPVFNTQCTTMENINIEVVHHDRYGSKNVFRLNSFDWTGQKGLLFK